MERTVPGVDKILWACSLYVVLVATQIRVTYTAAKTTNVTLKTNQTGPQVLRDPQEKMSLLRAEGASQSLLPLTNLHDLKVNQISMTVFSYLDNINIICQRKIRMGNLGDGGWEVCDDMNIRPKQPCIVYSFGIGNDFSFDDDISTIYKCHVYSFDPNIPFKNHNRSDYVHFYQLGIASKMYKKDANYRTMSQISSMLKHEKSHISVLKIDVGGVEWDILQQIAKSQMLKNVDQLLVEYNIMSLKRADLLRYLMVLREVEMAGMKIFYTQKKESCLQNVTNFPTLVSGCFQVHYINSKV